MEEFKFVIEALEGIKDEFKDDRKYYGDKLDNISKIVAYTNGRVTELEKKEIENRAKVEILIAIKSKNDIINVILKWVFGIVAVVIAAVLLKIILKQ